MLCRSSPKLLEGFLIQIEFEGDNSFHGISLMTAFDKRYIDKQFAQKYQDIKKQAAKIKGKSPRLLLYTIPCRRHCV